MYFKSSSVNKVSIGYWNGIAFVANESASGYPRIGVTDAGVPQFWTNSGANTYTLYHTGNANLSSVAWTTAHLDTYGSIELRADGGSWNEGLRMHPASNGWSGVVFCEVSNSGGSGTSASTWSIHNNEGTFGMYRYGSDFSGATAGLSCIGNSWYMKTGLTLTGNFSATGAVTAGSASSVYLKQNIKTMTAEYAKNIVLNSRPVTFEWNALATSLYKDYKGEDIGMVAEETEHLIPMAIGTIFEKYKRLDYTKFVAPLVCVAQDHELRIRELERENKELKEEIKRLRS